MDSVVAGAIGRPAKPTTWALPRCRASAMAWEYPDISARVMTSAAVARATPANAASEVPRSSRPVRRRRKRIASSRSRFTRGV